MYFVYGLGGRLLLFFLFSHRRVFVASHLQVLPCVVWVVLWGWSQHLAVVYPTLAPRNVVHWFIFSPPSNGLLPPHPICDN